MFLLFEHETSQHLFMMDYEEYLFESIELSSMIRLVKQYDMKGKQD
jgi:hypothetical protein